MHVRGSKLSIGRTRPTVVAGFAGGVTLAVCGAPAFADIDPLSGIDFATITHPGNSAFATTDPFNPVNGRGRVDYHYRIGRTEVPTASWVEFFNAAFDRPAGDAIPHISVPGFWGAVPAVPMNPGGRRWRVPAGNEMIPTGNISWRMAAIYCNWLCNNKATNREAFLSGAYEVSTFGFQNGTIPLRFTDQVAHTPGARYWIPTWDEWLKAAHFDPNKPNPDGSAGGWWNYGNSSDTPYVYGPPGVLVNGVPGEVNAAWDDRNFSGWSPYRVPLGAYAAVQSPWGLWDVAGGTQEWTESLVVNTIGERFRFADGSYWGGTSAYDRILVFQGDYPDIDTLNFGFRIATSVPAPSACALVAGVFLYPRRRRSVRAGWPEELMVGPEIDQVRLGGGPWTFPGDRPEAYLGESTA